MNAQAKALKAGDQAEADRLQKLIDQVKKLRGDEAAGLGPGIAGFAGPSAYTVGKGESPLSIGQKLFGFADLSLVKLFAEFNPEMFRVDPATGDFIFVGQPGDVLDLSFAAAPGLLGADARFLNAPFGPGAGAPGAGAPATLDPAAAAVLDASLESQRQEDIERGGIFAPPVGDPRTSGDFTPDQLAPPPAPFGTLGLGEPTTVGPYTVLPQQPISTANIFGGGVAGIDPMVAAETAARQAEGAGIPPTFPAAGQPATAPGAALPAAPSTTVVDGERGVPFIGGIMGSENDPISQASAAFTQAIYEASLDPSDPASRGKLPLIVPNEVAQFTAPQYASSANDFSVSATEFMTGMNYWQDDNDDWHRIDITTSPSTYQGGGRMYRNGVSTRNRYYRFEKGRLKGPRIPGPPRKPSPRGSTSRTFPGTIMWNVRFPELT
jgi:hypothetical protein